MKTRKIRYAVVGQGYFAQAAILPAFAHSKKAELTALVSGETRKLKALGRKYRVADLCDYSGYDYLLQSGDIDAVYIALPNWMHREYAEKAIQAGIHVLCEKPLAVTVEECERLIRLAEDRGVKLMTAYRLHFEETNLSAIQLVQGGKIGEPRAFNSFFSLPVKPDNIRAMTPKTGGGPVYDIGVYCINAARYLFREEPIEVHAWAHNRPGSELKEIDETVSVQMRFPEGRVATFTVSYATASVDYFDVVGTKGSICVEPAFDFASPKTMWISRGEKTSQKKFAKRDQVAPELDYFSDCILKDRQPEPSGLEGLIDVMIIQAIHRSLETGSPIELEIPRRRLRPGLRQNIRRAPVRSQPKLIAAAEPARKSA